LELRLLAHLAERHPFALEPVRSIVGGRLRSLRGSPAEREEGLEKQRARIVSRLREQLRLAAPPKTPETTPGVSAGERLKLATNEVIDSVDAFLRRDSITASLTAEERIEILRGMILTRATDDRLKALYLGGEIRFNKGAFQGKGFRSLGQEAIYAAAIRLRRGERYRDGDGTWTGDVVAPLIRDLGAALAMHPVGETVRMVLRCQMGKSGPPMNGKDLHIGDFSRGILPATAPLGIPALTAAGMAMAFSMRGEDRVAVCFIGDGGCSLGEWHEAINLCAARRLPAIFCIENNQTALSTPLGDQCAARVFADKASGYGVPGLTLDGTDPDAIASAFAWAAERAREGRGPTLLELVSMRMCGHAHHDDMLYLGREPQTRSWSYPSPTEAGYVDPRSYAFWSRKDPLRSYAARLVSDGVIEDGDLGRFITEAESMVQAEARAVIDAPWPAAEEAGSGVCAGEPSRGRVEPLENRAQRVADRPAVGPLLNPGPAFDPGGRTFLEAVMLGVGDALREDPRVFVYGEDVGGDYGNAFLMLRPLLQKFGERIINSPLSEAGILGVCVGAALAGQRPIGEMQFNDFVATGFNQLVNNAAKIRYRWGGSAPMVVRMPWGGLRRAGPYHSQNTEPWFYRTPGLKIVVPSTPHDARALMAAGVADPDPVLYYEHIALYRAPGIRQRLTEDPPPPIPLGTAALRRDGSDLAIVSYGAFVHRSLALAEKLAGDGIDAAVLDLRTLAPLDRDSVLALARRIGKVLIVHEDSRTGGIGESLAAMIQEEAFEYLDAPVRIVGALDTPVPYSPPLEDVYLPGDEVLERAARLLVDY
jgi:2-oxoisovalerate dehydrogenase E1 component